MQFYSKNNKNCFFSLISWPIFILFVLSDRARWRLQNLYTKFRNSLIMLISANLRSPGRDPGVQSAIFFFFFFFIIIFLFFSFHVPSGASNFYFLTSRKLYHMKFVIFDVARCRMSATSLTFWFPCSKMILLMMVIEVYNPKNLVKVNIVCAN